MTDVPLEATAMQVEGDVAVIAITGDVVPSAENRLMAAYAGVEDARAVVLDFAGLAYMNSGGIGLLVTLLVRAQRSGQHLLASGLSDHYRQIFELTRLDDVITLHASREEALEAVAHEDAGVTGLDGEA